MPDMSCGEPNWAYEQILDGIQQEIDPVQQQIQELKSQIMSMQLRIQSDELEKLMEKVVRDENPTLKDAWDKYQSLLMLTGNK